VILLNVVAALLLAGANVTPTATPTTAAADPPRDRTIAEWVAQLASGNNADILEAWSALTGADVAAVPALVMALENANEDTSIGAICALLAQLGSDARESAPVLERLAAKRPRDLPTIARALSSVDPDRMRPLAPALAECANADPSRRDTCEEAILFTGAPESVPFFLQRLSDDDPDVRAHAARMARNVPGSSAVRDGLETALHDPVLAVRISAASTLVRSGDSVSDTTLSTLLKGVCHGRGFDLYVAAETLDDVPTLVPRARDELIRLLRNGDHDCRVRAAVGLAWIDANRAVPALPLLREALQDEDPHVRRMAAIDLASMGGSARGVRRDVVRLKDDDDRDVRQAATQAEGMIATPPLWTRRIGELRLVATDGARADTKAYLADGYGRIWSVTVGQRFLDGCLERIGAESINVSTEEVTEAYATVPKLLTQRLFRDRAAESFEYGKEYTGHPTSVDFAGDLANFARMFADMSGLEIVLGDGANRHVQIAARNSPWDATFQAGLRRAGLRYRLEGKTVHVEPESAPTAAPTPAVLTAPSPRTSADWIQLLRSNDLEQVKAAWTAITKADDAVAALVSALEHLDDQTPVRKICMILRQMSSRAEKSADAIERAAAARPRDQPYPAIALAYIAPERARPFVPMLAACAINESFANRQYCVEGLLRTGAPESLPFLLDGLKDEDPEQRAVAARFAQSHLSDDLVRAALGRALDDSDLHVRVAAASAFLAAKSPAPATALPTLMKGVCHGSTYDLQTVAWTLYNGPAPLAPKGEEELIHLLKDANQECRVRAAVALAYVHPNRGIPALPLLREGLRHPDADLRSATLRSLRLMGLPARDLLPDIEKLLDDSDEDVRSAAKKSKSYIERPGLSGRRLGQARLVALDVRDGAPIAYLMTDDGFVWGIRAGQEFLDGRIESIEREAIMFVGERVADDLSVTPRRERVALFPKGEPAVAMGNGVDFTGHCVSMNFEGDASSFSGLVYLIAGLNVALEAGADVPIHAAGRDEWWDSIVIHSIREAGLDYRIDDTTIRFGRRDQADRMRLLGKTSYKGRPLSLSFRRGAMPEIQKIFENVSGLRFHWPSMADEPATLYLAEFPWDQALDLLLATRHWAARFEDSDVYIEPEPPVDPTPSPLR
jgi:HEAT repeat protein